MNLAQTICALLTVVLSILAAACSPQANKDTNIRAVNGVAPAPASRQDLLQGLWLLDGDGDSLVIHMEANRRASRQQLEAGYGYDTWTLKGDTLVIESLLWGRQIRTRIIYIDSNVFIEEGDYYTNHWKRICSSDSLTY